jgi:DNA-directed RNA polymerase subunit H (RpoH/RPB5)
MYIIIIKMSEKARAFPQLLPIQKNRDKEREDILTNVIKMLTNRGLLKKSDLNENISKITESIRETDEYKITLDYPERYYENENKTFIVKIINQKIAGVSKTSIIGEFLYENKNSPKIVVVNSITSKALNQIETEFKNTEVFLERELMIDLVSHVAVPKHELLTDKDAEQVLQEYETKKREMPKIFITDPVAKYFNARLGQIFRIIRSSETSGQSAYYRLVIKGTIAS